MLKIKIPKLEGLQPKCVIKIEAGKYFYIGRSLNFDFVTTELRRLYGQYISHREGANSAHLYFPIVENIYAKGIDELTVSIIFQSESGYAVLKEELNQLVANYENKWCLNANKVPYVPKFKTPKSTSKWLTHNEFLNFKKLLSKYEF